MIYKENLSLRPLIYCSMTQYIIRELIAQEIIVDLKKSRMLPGRKLIFPLLDRKKGTRKTGVHIRYHHHGDLKNLPKDQKHGICEWRKTTSMVKEKGKIKCGPMKTSNP